jgi:hypothetical protein
MTATYTFDIFSTLDGYGSYTANANWGGYWGKQGPEFLDHRLALYSARAADGLRGQHLSAVRAAAGSEHRARRARFEDQVDQVVVVVLSEPRLAVVAITDRSVYLTVW